MKKIALTIMAMVIAVSVFADNFVSLPIAISDADHNNPTIMLNVAKILCDTLGLPYTSESYAIALGVFPLTQVTNVVGNASIDVVAGSTWWISCNSGKNVLGDNISQAQAKVDNAKTKKIGDTLIGSITCYPQTWFNFWGIVSQAE